MHRFQIMIEGVVGNNHRSDIAIDDIMLYPYACEGEAIVTTTTVPVLTLPTTTSAEGEIDDYGSGSGSGGSGDDFNGSGIRDPDGFTGMKDTLP